MAKRTLAVRRLGFRDAKMFFHIACEGNETEPRYFQLFRPPRDAKFQLKVIPSRHKSSPTEVLATLKTFFNKNGRKGDEAWIVIDRDAWQETELNDICRQAAHLGFKVAMSNPCFELWLYLHLRDNTQFAHRHHCQDELSQHLPGYSRTAKSTYDTAILATGVRDAVRRARALDRHPNQPWPHHQSTRVYLLIEKIHEAQENPLGV